MTEQFKKLTLEQIEAEFELCCRQKSVKQLEGMLERASGIVHDHGSEVGRKIEIIERIVAEREQS